MSGLIVETTGIPGSGKTTVAGLLSGELEQRGFPSWTAKEVRALYQERVVSPKILVHRVRRDQRLKSARRKRFLGKEVPRMMRKFQRRYPSGWQIFESRIQAIRSSDPEQADMLRRWVENHALTFMMLRTWRMNFRVYLSEEGIAHRAVNLFVSDTGEPNREELRRFVQGWAYPDVLIRVQADVDRSLERIQVRGLTKRLQGRSESEIQRLLSTSKTVVDEVCDEARRRHTPLLVVDNSGAKEQLGDAHSSYRECLEAILKRARLAR